MPSSKPEPIVQGIPGLEEKLYGMLIDGPKLDMLNGLLAKYAGRVRQAPQGQLRDDFSRMISMPFHIATKEQVESAATAMLDAMRPVLDRVRYVTLIRSPTYTPPSSMPSIECTVLRRLRNAFAPRTLDAIYLHAEDEHRVVCATDAGGEHRAAHEPRLEGKPANTTEVLVEQSKIVAIGIALITCIGAAALWLNKSPGKRSSTTSKRKPRKLGKR